MSWQSLWREVRLEVSLMTLIAALVMVVEAVTQSFWGSGAPQFLKDIHATVGGWIIWVWFFGLLFLLGGGYYTWDCVRKRREFRHLIDTTSRQKFLRNRERIELLAYILPRAYEREMRKKMKELDVT